MSLPKWCSDTLRTRKHDTRIIVWSIGMGFFVGVSGTYLLEHGLYLSVVALLGAAGILAGAAILWVSQSEQVASSASQTHTRQFAANQVAMGLSAQRCDSP